MRHRRTLPASLAFGLLTFAALLYATPGASARPSHLGSGEPGELFGVAALSSTDVWAVGYGGTDENETTRADHWDGSKWQRIASPHPGSESELRSVSAVSADDVWAGGYTRNPTFQPLVVHWDGSTWTRSPVVPISGRIIYGISADAPDDVWAVGGDEFGLHGFIEHWDGSTWSEVADPTDGQLRSVSAVSSSDAWAVGYTVSENERKEMTLAEHWDGTSWSVVSSGDPDLRLNVFWAVSVMPSGDAWAVGSWGGDPGGKARTTWGFRHTHTLAEQWDGAGWTTVASPSPKPDALLHSVSAEAPNDVWAVGERQEPYQNLIEHWDGTSWAKVPTLHPPGDTVLLGVSADSPTDAWTVGFSDRPPFERPGIDEQFYTWVEHWDGTSWTKF